MFVPRDLPKSMNIGATVGLCGESGSGLLFSLSVELSFASSCLSLCRSSALGDSNTRGSVTSLLGILPSNVLSRARIYIVGCERRRVVKGIYLEYL